MSDTQKLLGKIIVGDAFRDAIHIAVAPVEAAQTLKPGQHVGLDTAGRAHAAESHIGIVDPLLPRNVAAGQRFFLYLYPGTITSLRHEWTHPAFPQEIILASGTKSASEAWMRKWAVEHMGYDYYGDTDKLSDEEAYENAIRAGRNISVGPYESAREFITHEWWNHWEIITGQRGEREDGHSFSCSC